MLYRLSSAVNVHILKGRKHATRIASGLSPREGAEFDTVLGIDVVWFAQRALKTWDKTLGHCGLVAGIAGLLAVLRGPCCARKGQTNHASLRSSALVCVVAAR